LLIPIKIYILVKMLYNWLNKFKEKHYLKFRNLEDRSLIWFKDLITKLKIITIKREATKSYKDNYLISLQQKDYLKVETMH
jgi:hypothetical protein